MLLSESVDSLKQHKITIPIKLQNTAPQAIADDKPKSETDI